MSDKKSSTKSTTKSLDLKKKSGSKRKTAPKNNSNSEMEVENSKPEDSKMQVEEPKTHHSNTGGGYSGPSDDFMDEYYNRAKEEVRKNRWHCIFCESLYCVASLLFCCCYLSRFSSREVPAHVFISVEQFLEQMLQTVVNEVGPYVPWMDEDASQEARDTQAWKCLNILRALKYEAKRREKVMSSGCVWLHFVLFCSQCYLRWGLRLNSFACPILTISPVAVFLTPEVEPG
jgi:hypothetical protein